MTSIELPLDPPRRSRLAALELSPHGLALGLILLFALAARLMLLPMPFVDDVEGVGSYYGVHARNYFRHDWSVTLGVPVQSMGVDPAVPPKFYHHHPPLVPLMIAGSYAVFGEGDWQTRLPTALSSVAGAAALYVLLRRSGRPRAGLLAAFIYATLPFTVYFGNQPELMNPTLVFFYVAATIAFYEMLDRPGWKTLALTCAVMLFLGATDWPGFYFVPVACGVFVWRSWRTRDEGTLRWEGRPWPRAWWWVFAFGLWSVVVFVVLNAQVVLAADQPWNWIADRVLMRGAGVGATEDFTWGNWWKYAWIYNNDNHGLPVMLLALAWMIVYSVRKERRRRAAEATALLLLVGLLNVVIGRQGCYAHPWWWWPVTPGLVMAAALMADDVVEWCSSRLSPRAVATGVVSLLLAYAAWNHWTTVPKLWVLQESLGGGVSPSRSLARAVRAAAPSINDTVIVMSGDTHPTLWYVADRPMKLHVWDVGSFEARITDDTADLPFGFIQKWKQAPIAAIIPREFEEVSPALLEHLRRKYAPLPVPSAVEKDYWVFDLRGTHSARDGERRRVRLAGLH